MEALSNTQGASSARRLRRLISASSFLCGPLLRGFATRLLQMNHPVLNRDGPFIDDDDDDDETAL